MDILDPDSFRSLVARFNAVDATPWSHAVPNDQAWAWMRDQVPWFDCPDTGLLEIYYYNHSSFCDLVITGLVGLQPREDPVVEVNPLVPDGAWPWFALDHVRYHGHDLQMIYDADGRHYGRGAGLALFVDGREVVRRAGCGRMLAPLPD